MSREFASAYAVIVLIRALCTGAICNLFAIHLGRIVFVRLFIRCITWLFRVGRCASLSPVDAQITCLLRERVLLM